VKSEASPVRVVTIIARLNIGGPAIQAISITKRLEDYGYRTTLVSGAEEPTEGNLGDLADQLGVRPLLLPWMRRNPGWRDIPALVALIRILRRERPHIVHTHAAKGGGLGRVAALIACRGRGRGAMLIHTFHGHSLTGYFSPRMAGLYRWIERFLARHTDRLIAVSEEVRDELVAIGVAPASKFGVVRLGLDLSSFAVNSSRRDQMRKALRAELGIPQEAVVVTLIARLVPIKRVDRFLRVAHALRDLTDIRFLIVGDGELREVLQHSAEAVALRDRLVWTGFRRDIPAVCFASDVVMQTSDNEGTPVSLIEAQAAGVPVVSTNVGGAASVVPEERLAAPTDIEGLTHLVRELVVDHPREPSAAIETAAIMRDRYGLPRLITELDRLYRRGLGCRAH
jgi:glycosyltransferase involved in cell wall biosynthesis